MYSILAQRFQTFFANAISHVSKIRKRCFQALKSKFRGVYDTTKFIPVYFNEV